MCQALDEVEQVIVADHGNYLCILISHKTEEYSCLRSHQDWELPMVRLAAMSREPSVGYIEPTWEGPGRG